MQRKKNVAWLVGVACLGLGCSAGGGGGSTSGGTGSPSSGPASGSFAWSGAGSLASGSAGGSGSAGSSSAGSTAGSGSSTSSGWRAPVSPTRSFLSFGPSTRLVADGVEAGTVTVNVRDAEGLPLAGHTVRITMTGDLNTIIQPEAPTPSNGVAAGSASSLRAEVKYVSATIDPDTPLAVALSSQVMVTYVPGPLAPELTVVSVDPPESPANGVDSIRITTALMDAHGNGVRLVLVTAQVTGGGNVVTPQNTYTDAAGIAALDLTSTEAGDKTVTIFADGAPVGSPRVVTFVALPPPPDAGVDAGVQCPAPADGRCLGDMPCPGTRVVAAGGTASWNVEASGLQNVMWSVAGGPPAGVSSALLTADGGSASFTPYIVGTYTLAASGSDADGGVQACTFRVIAGTHGLRVELTWDGTGDVDLHLHNQAATAWCTADDCFYANCRTGLPWGATLDVDNTLANGPENIRINAPQAGLRYVIGVDNFSRATGRIASVNVYCGASQLTTPVQRFVSTPLSDSAFWKVAAVTFESPDVCTIEPLGMYGTQSCGF